MSLLSGLFDLLASLFRPRAQPQPQSPWVLVQSTRYWDIYVDRTWLQNYQPQLLPLSHPDTFIPQLEADFGCSIWDLPNGKPRLALVLDPQHPRRPHGNLYGPIRGDCPCGLGLQPGPGDSVLVQLLSLHETVNVWTAKVARGWIWAGGSPLLNGTSPFPGAVDIIVTQEISQNQVSQMQAQSMANDAGAQLTLNLQRTYGWDIFRKLFQETRNSGITDWRNYDEPLRTAIVVTFLSRAAGTDLLNQFNAAIQTISGQTVPQEVYQQAQTMIP